MIGVHTNSKYVYLFIYECFYIHDDVIDAPRQKCPQYKYPQCPSMSLVNGSHCSAPDFLSLSLFLWKKRATSSCAHGVAQWPKLATVTKHTTLIHVSILYLDKVFQSREIPRSQWQLFATACISVAAKYEEAEEHCPPIPDLLNLTKLSNAGHCSHRLFPALVPMACCLQPLCPRQYPSHLSSFKCFVMNVPRRTSSAVLTWGNMRL
jgi:hypothetical protein